MNHEDEILALLPWYVNGTLSDEERARVDAWLEQGGESARAELALYERLRERVRDEVPGQTATDLGWKRVQGRIRKERKTVTRWMVPALAASLLVIVVQAGLLGHLWFSRPQSLGWQPLSGAEQAGLRIQVVFRSEARLEQIQSLLRELRLRIVDGPSATGVYHLQPEDAQTDIDALIARLKGAPELVAHAARD